MSAKHLYTYQINNIRAIEKLQVFYLELRVDQLLGNYLQAV